MLIISVQQEDVYNPTNKASSQTKMSGHKPASNPAQMSSRHKLLYTKSKASSTLGLDHAIPDHTKTLAEDMLRVSTFLVG